MRVALLLLLAACASPGECVCAPSAATYAVVEQPKSLLGLPLHCPDAGPCVVPQGAL